MIQRVVARWGAEGESSQAEGQDEKLKASYPSKAQRHTRR